MIGFPEIVCGITGCVAGSGDFYRFLGSFDVVGGDLGCGFCRVVCVPVFLYEFKGMIEVLNRFPGVVCSFIAFPVDQEFMPVALVAVIEYFLSLPFLCIVNKNGGGLVHSPGLKPIGVIFPVFLEGGKVEVGLLGGYSSW